MSIKSLPATRMRVLTDLPGLS